MVYILKSLAVLQLLTGCFSSATLVPRQRGAAGRQALPPKPTNNNTWLISDVNFYHPGPALKRRADNVGGIRFSLQRSVTESGKEFRTITYVPVPRNKAISCGYGVLSEVVRSEWRLCSGYYVENAPPGDQSMTDELSNRLRFRLSNLKTSPSGNFQSVTLEIVNHVAPQRYMHGDVPNAPGAWDPEPMVIVYSTKVELKSSGKHPAKCSLRHPNMTAGPGWEECQWGEMPGLVKTETITKPVFERKYWKLQQTCSKESDGWKYYTRGN